MYGKHSSGGASGNRTNQSKLFAEHLLLSLFVGCLAFAGAMLLFAQLLAHGHLPLYAASPLSTLSLAMGVFAVSITMCRQYTRQGGIISLCLALLMGITFAGVSFYQEPSQFGIASVTRLAALLAAAILGFIIGSNSSKHRKKTGRV